ncbi:hypothetical protein [Gemmobacter serpentinus]|uniref:hypothetical protein n=1 Tax=Gemmobacter serpentinus TaxID=2652247 RepID=UPI001CF70FCE|nr:hypothetical protein [Gemmobacter serpentinus]
MNAMTGGPQAMIRAAASILDQMRAEDAQRAGPVARGAERLRGRQAILQIPTPVVDTWTPKLVGERFVAALRWATYSGGAVGPAGIRGSMPAYNPTMDDHLDEGWGLPEVAGDGEPGDGKRLVVQATAAQVTAYEAALIWPAVYLYPAYEGSARMLCLWARCKARRVSFDAAVKRRGTIARATAYRMRDRGLSIISVGLDRDWR